MCQGKTMIKYGLSRAYIPCHYCFCFCSLSVSYPLETDTWSRCFICSSRGSSVKRRRLTFPKPPISTCSSTRLPFSSAFGTRLPRLCLPPSSFVGPSSNPAPAHGLRSTTFDSSAHRVSRCHTSPQESNLDVRSAHGSGNPHGKVFALYHNTSPN